MSEKQRQTVTSTIDYNLSDVKKDHVCYVSSCASITNQRDRYINRKRQVVQEVQSMLPFTPSRNRERCAIVCCRTVRGHRAISQASVYAC